MFQLKTKVQGFYKLDAVRIVDGKEIKRSLTGKFPNLITDAGLDSIASINFLIGCYVGTGSTTPNVTDIALENLIATTSTVNSVTTTINSTSPYYFKQVKVFRFNVGTATGNLSEVGVGHMFYDTPYPLFSRALILDSFGNPTTITILSDEYLDVTYEFRYYPFTDDVTGSITFTGNIGGTYDYVFRHSLIDVVKNATNPYMGSLYADTYRPTDSLVYDGPIGSIFERPTGTSLYYQSHSNSTYVAGSKELFLTLPSAPADIVLANGIKSIFFGWGFMTYQIEFTPAIPKTATDVLTLVFHHQWDRA